MYLSVGTRACVCAVYVWAAWVRVGGLPTCACWGKASMRPGDIRFVVRLLTLYFSSPSLFSGQCWHFDGVGNQVRH